MRSLLPALLFLLPCAVEAQKASYTYFGTDCVNGCTLTAQFKATTQPRIGQSFSVNVSGLHCSVGQTWFFLLTGVSKTKWGGVNLPAKLTFIVGGFSALGSGRCRLRVSPEFITPISSSIVKFQIPNSTLLLGVKFYQQVVGAGTLWEVGPPLYWASSRGGVGVIGR